MQYFICSCKQTILFVYSHIKVSCNVIDFITIYTGVGKSYLTTQRSARSLLSSELIRVFIVQKWGSKFAKFQLTISTKCIHGYAMTKLIDNNPISDGKLGNKSPVGAANSLGSSRGWLGGQPPYSAILLKYCIPSQVSL